jgi:hypothetical protein
MELDLQSPVHNAAGMVKQSIGARNRVGIGLSYRPARYAGWQKIP